jgi:hypothetical protein
MKIRHPTSTGNTRVAAVRALRDYVLRVQFMPERTMTVDLREPIHRLKSLRALRDPATFARAHVGEDGYSVAWSNEIDMSADRLLEMSLEQAGRSDAVEFIRWRWRNELSLTASALALGISRRQVAYYSSGEHEVPRTVLLACKGWEVERAGAVA